ncbi:MAG TPA: cyclodeaminase/cyclohydrolase family protein [Anaerolineae bacterium]|nr:cyclodeaminase/cyclohydrolase family protein [Anaerolineae bacterium]
MKDLYSWVESMANEPLPGGVAAGALAAAMGAALVAKAARVTLRRQQMSDPDRARVTAVLARSQTQRTELIALAAADEQAYQAVLNTRQLAVDDAGRRQAWLAATEVPLRLAEACQVILGDAAEICAFCWPVVCSDFEIGRWLLEAAQQTGVLAAESNLAMRAHEPEGQALQARLQNLCRSGDGGMQG